MSKIESYPGLVFETPGVTIVDSRAMDWEESDYVPGSVRRVLARDEDGEPIVLQRWLPPARICHPWPSQRLGVITQGKSRMR